MRDPWTVLGVDRSASPEDIKKAYKKLVKEHHPDIGGAPDRFREIQEAYQQLEKQQTSHQQHDSVFNDIFSQFAGFKFGHTAFRNQNFEAVVTISLAESINGTSHNFQINIGSNNQTLKLEIPKGMSHGDTVKYSGMGSSQIPNLPPGDLFVRINIEMPAGYTLVSDTVFTQVNVTVWEAILGTTVDVDDPAGGKIKITVPANTDPNTTLRIPGRGGWNRYLNQRGDMMVKINITIPEITEEQRQIISVWV